MATAFSCLFNRNRWVLGDGVEHVDGQFDIGGSIEVTEGKARGAERISAQRLMGAGRAVEAGTGHEPPPFKKPVRQFERRKIIQANRDHGHLFGGVARAVDLQRFDITNPFQKLGRQAFFMRTDFGDGFADQEFQAALQSGKAQGIVRSRLVFIRKKIRLDFLFRLAPRPAFTQRFKIEASVI